MVDTLDAVIEGAFNGVKAGPGLFWAEFGRECVLRLNFVGIGRFTIALGTDTVMGLKKSQKSRERMLLKAEALYLMETKMYYGDSLMWTAVKDQKEAINSTQDAVRSIAEAQTALTDAQKMLFKNQQKMADGMRYLLMLGASSIAMNRVVITELESKLKQASEEQLSEQTREELIGVVRLLREQESAFSKQERMSDQIKSHGREIASIQKVDALQDETDRKHDSLIAENASKNVEQDEKIAASVKKDLEQDNEIHRQQDVDRQHDELLKTVRNLALLGIGIAVIALIISIIALFQ